MFRNTCTNFQHLWYSLWILSRVCTSLGTSGTGFARQVESAPVWALEAQFVLVKVILHQFAARTVQLVHVKSNLYQLAARTAQGGTLVKTIPVSVLVARSVRAGRAQPELSKLKVCQKQACTRSAAVYIYSLIVEREEESS